MGTKSSAGSENDESARHVAALVESLAVDCVLDVGANEGQWASALRRAGYRGPIISFEPLEAAFERLRAAAENDPQWRVQRVALGAEDGKITFHRTRDSRLSSALTPTRYAQSLFREAVEIVAGEVVPVRRLDGLLPELLPDLATARLFLKIDTQGFDLEVFAGAQGVLSRIVGLQSELSVFPFHYERMPGWLDGLAAYAARGYAPTGFFPLGGTRPPYHVLTEFDWVMVRHRRISAGAPAPDGPPVTVVVTACADSTALRECLGAVREQAHALGGELLLAMNISSTALAAEARHALEALCDRLVFEPRVGKSHALNSAVSLSRGAVIAFTEDDAEPQPGWLAALSAPLLAPDRDPPLVGCGGAVLPVYPQEGMPAWFRPMVEENQGKARMTLSLTPVHDLGQLSVDYQERTAPIGANCAYLREVFTSYHYDTRLGPNRETGLRGGEDALLGRLLLRDGYRLRYCPDARVRHRAHPEHMTEACLRRASYFSGVEHCRARCILRGSRAQKMSKFWPKVIILQLASLLFDLLPVRERCATIRMRWIAKYEHARGQLTELRKWNPR